MIIIIGGCNATFPILKNDTTWVLVLVPDDSTGDMQQTDSFQRDSDFRRGASILKKSRRYCCLFHRTVISCPSRKIVHIVKAFEKESEEAKSPGKDPEVGAVCGQAVVIGKFRQNFSVNDNQYPSGKTT